LSNLSSVEFNLISILVIAFSTLSIWFIVSLWDTASVSYMLSILSAYSLIFLLSSFMLLSFESWYWIFEFNAVSAIHKFDFNKLMSTSSSSFLLSNYCSFWRTALISLVIFLIFSSALVFDICAFCQRSFSLEFLCRNLIIFVDWCPLKHSFHQIRFLLPRFQI
jgi:hypothetical protein